MDNEMNLKSAYDSLKRKELEQRKTIKQMSERIKELEALVSKNESLHLVSNRDVFSDLRQLGLSSEQCSIVGAYIKSL